MIRGSDEMNSVLDFVGFDLMFCNMYMGGHDFLFFDILLDND